MRRSLFLIVIAVIVYSCKDNVNDKGKRNESWVWWVDAKTGKANWIPVEKDGLGVQNGKYTLFYFNGNVFAKGRLVNGQDVDTIFNFDIKGYLQEYRILSKDTMEYFVQNGPIKMYYQSGAIKAIGEVKNHTYGDHWVTDFENGKHGYIRSLKNDTGWIMRYYDTGAIKDSTYVEGKNEFSFKYFYPFPVGRLRKSVELQDNSDTGIQKEYYSSGRLKAICNLVNGVFNGKQTRWYEDGHLLDVGYRKNGVFDGGPQIAYYDNGKVQAIFNAKNGKPEGEVKRYDENGKLTADYIMQDGVVTKNLLPDSAKSHKPHK
jgi:antitoxin component YwqK of YwqJK toxin-antitoxin module